MNLLKLFLANPSVTTDTRNIQKNDIFFALKGKNFNGNNFATQALEMGASFVVVDENVKIEDYRIIQVDNVLVSLQNLAREYRLHLGAKVIGLTGSNGKTTTKELLACVLSSKFAIHFTKGNLNNEIGVPLTILSAPLSTEIMIVEMGANHQGEIALLSEIALPDYGLINNIGKAHLEGFGGEEGVLKGKTELYRNIEKREGVIFVNEQDDKLLQNLPSSTTNIFYSPNNYEIITTQPYLAIKNKKEDVKIQTQLVGEYNIANIAAAMAIGVYFGVSPIVAASCIESYMPSNNRSQLLSLNNLTIIKDAYNANPSSVMASLTAFAARNDENKMVILGDMLELGEYASAEHENILKFLANSDFKKCVFIGEIYYTFKNKYSGEFYQSISHAKDSGFDINQYQYHAILLKGSRGIALEKLLLN
jgi:UDP-N-acetylmuramoyl-tripeptide--D-alanyl-D-alanine ligase